MNRMFSALLLLALLEAVATAAQNHGLHGASEQANPPSPYSGMETRSVKALSGEQIADLGAGRGMGLALAAELNGYPGPSHVLELAETLGLTGKQATRTRELLGQMEAETIPLGKRLVNEEAELDRLFAQRTITATRLIEMTKAIADLQGALRTAHLRYHLDMVQLLTPEQVRRYSQLRGYAGSAN
ncbi:Spy/CpxP family protein refolding chaperone [Mesorhizobium sp. M0488]|uniref:Spy/CpxP family protein refolding chaperone n=1 Tax=unclassified Mesorhizobium TaxID=325217 RepID=UPI00333766D9